MQRFKGVATKYLDAYLGWFRMLDRSGPAGLQPALVFRRSNGESELHWHSLEQHERWLQRVLHKR
jgi:hypothetical protein